VFVVLIAAVHVDVDVVVIFVVVLVVILVVVFVSFLLFLVVPIHEIPLLSNGFESRKEISKSISFLLC
jgi:hypothetical protein